MFDNSFEMINFITEIMFKNWTYEKVITNNSLSYLKNLNNIIVP